MKIAIWDNSAYQYKGKKEAEQVIARLIKARADIYLPFTLCLGKISHKSSFIKGKNDFLSPMVELAKREKIEVHPVIGFGAAGIGYFHKDRTYHTADSWKEVKKKWVWGKEALLNWACPSWKENREKTIALIKELIENYQIDGIHFDYLRYPNATELLIDHPCECKACRKERFKYLGKEKLSKAELADPGVQFLEAKYRNRFIREFVIAVRAITKPKGLKVSLAARNYLPMASWKAYAVLEGQDWVEWCREGLLDFVCPMTYTTSLKYFQTWMHQFQGLTKNLPVKLYEGIGKRSSAGMITRAQMINQAKAAKDRKAGGITIFQLNALDDGDLQALAQFKGEEN